MPTLRKIEAPADIRPVPKRKRPAAPAPALAPPPPPRGPLRSLRLRFLKALWEATFDPDQAAYAELLRQEILLRARLAAYLDETDAVRLEGAPV